jgi:hypothetical protein
MITCASRRVRNHSTLKHSSRNQPLSDSLVPVCHGFAGSMMGRFDTCFGQPLQDRPADKLRPAVGTQIGGGAMLAHKPGQYVDDARGANAPGYVDRETFVGKLVDDSQALELLTVGARIENEVGRPRRGWRLAAATRVVDWQRFAGAAVGAARPAWRHKRRTGLTLMGRPSRRRKMRIRRKP